MANPEDNLLKFKLCVVGESGVGKTSLIRRYSTGQFDVGTKSTIGVDFMTKRVTIDAMECNFMIWDFAGEDKFRKMLPSYVSGASGALVMFDLTNPASFTKLPEWIEILRANQDDLVLFLVGNKKDLVEPVPTGLAAPAFREANMLPADLVQKYDMEKYVPTSAKDGTNVNQAFVDLGRAIIDVALRPCPACGRMIPRQLLFCQYCGAKLGKK